MEKITAKDGTPIAYQAGGTGPPLVLVHGMLGASERWPILQFLQPHFTCYTYQRRGRGNSGDHPDHSLNHEVEDLLAIFKTIGDPVCLLGQSFGGLIAIEATRRTAQVQRLIAYEPSPAPVSLAVLSQLQTLLAEGESTTAVLTFLRELVKMPPAEVALFQSSPSFPLMAAAAHTLPRELTAEANYQIDPQRFTQWHTPTLLLLGEQSPPAVHTTIRNWHTALPNSQLVVLPGQQHIAHYTAPEEFAKTIINFLVHQ